MPRSRHAEVTVRGRRASAPAQQHALGPGQHRGDQQAEDRQHQHPGQQLRSEEHTSELQSLMRISYAVFCLKKKKVLHVPKCNTDYSSDQYTKRIPHLQTTDTIESIVCLMILNIPQTK